MGFCMSLGSVRLGQSRQPVSTGDTSRAAEPLGESVPRLVGEKAQTAGGMSCQEHCH
jgi:hypothetical protein